VATDFRSAYRGKRVFVTGHTGFKGSWLTEWLLSLGAEITGYSLPPPTDPALFDQLGLVKRIAHIEADIRDADRVARAIAEAQPDFVFHLAAQPLVRQSYEQPRETYDVNVMGTLHLLEALRPLEHKCAAVMITTDKCYENREWLYGYREEDALGGYDPYSSSKAAAELVIAAYRRSFFAESPVAIASARAGNVIGGGDWATDRIVPDCMRALRKGESIPIRNRNATRPWQHVLEPLSGYLLLGASLIDGRRDLASAFNFGPNLQSNRTVGELVERVLQFWPGQAFDALDGNAPHEAGRLNLAADKAFHLLGWGPVWDFDQTIEKTVDWYRQTAKFQRSEDFQQLTQAQIREYEKQRWKPAKN
jgi:CDP-glucose 4,6-dehydratase